MRLRLNTVLEADAERTWDAVQTPALMCAVARPLADFVPLQGFPRRWSEGAYPARIKALGLIGLGSQWIVPRVEEEDRDAGRYVLRDQGHGDLIARWDHRITVRRRGDGRCGYSDDVDIGAGLLTAPIWLFAAILFRHRQRRLRRFARRDFDGIV